MKKLTFTSLMLALTMLLGMVSCSEHDDFESNNPLGDKIEGTFYKFYETEGKLDNVIDQIEQPRKYTRVVEVYRFQGFGEGEWNRYFFDNESGEPFADLGGGSGGMGRFQYTTLADGTVSLKLDNPDAASNTNYAPLHRQLTLVNGQLNANGIDGQSLALDKADESTLATIGNWNVKLHGGSGGTGVDFNINENIFTAANWRTQKSIYLYTETGKEKDSNGDEGYKEVNLPWNDTDVITTNLPNGFCDAITPENGWELLYNHCGNRATTNGNFFFLYNKFMGIMRVFYYQPQVFDTGNDQVWEVDLTDNIAEHALWSYGLPLGSTFKNRAKASMTGSGTQIDYISPWARSRSDDGLIVPNEGWWAFDVDLSQYRPSADPSKDKMTLQMRSWEKEQMTLFSTMTANIDGTLKQQIKESGGSGASIAKGVCIAGQAIFSGVSAYKGFTSGNPMGVAAGFGAIANIFGCGGAFAGLFGNDPQPFEATISLGMNGTINTSGMVSGSKPTVGIASPTFPMSRFNLKNVPSFGHGVWNIKSAPKVYVVKDLCVDWRRQDMDGDDFNFNNIAYPWHKSPFDGAANIYPRNDSWEADEKPFRGVVCFFDPSSIEVELNPDVFPAGTPYKVTAVCGVHKGMTLGCIDRFREAQGMGNSQISTTGVSHNLDAHISDRPLTEAAFDGLYGFSDDQTKGFTTGTKFDVEDYNTYKVGAFGRGNGNYLIEPMGLTGGQWDYANLPAYEVAVVVTVTLNGKEYVYCRSYLPEYMQIEARQMPDVCTKAQAADKTHFTDIYGSQVARMQSLYQWIATTPICDNSIQTCDGNDWSPEEESGYALLDANPVSIWYSSEKSRNLPNDLALFSMPYSNKSKVGNWTCSWVEFHTFRPNTAKSFTLQHRFYYPIGNVPRDIRLLARKSPQAEWKEIYYEQNLNNRLDGKQQTASVVCNIPADKQGQYQYYRVECSGSDGGYALAELTMNY